MTTTVDPRLEPAYAALERFRLALEQHRIQDAIEQNSLGMALGTDAFLRLVAHLRAVLVAQGADDIPGELVEEIPSLVKRLDRTAQQLVPQLPSSSAVHVAPGILSVLLYAVSRWEPLRGWRAMPPDQAIPVGVADRVQTMRQQLEHVEQAIQPARSKLASVLQETRGAKNRLGALRNALSDAEEVGEALRNSLQHWEQLRNEVDGRLVTASDAALRASQVKGEIDKLSETAKEHTEQISTALGQCKLSLEQVQKAHQDSAQAAEAIDKLRDAAAKAEESIKHHEAYVDSAREEIARVRQEIAEHRQNAQKDKGGAAAANQEALNHAVQAQDAALKAKSEAEAAAQAHNLSTTVGLAGAFNERAIAARRNGWIWTALLAGALGLASTVGFTRVEAVSELLRIKAEPWAVGAQLALSLFTVGAPVWFAWIATKQVAHLFRLTEDYAYKASLAKAYQGFRDQARELDPEFSARLFSSALTHLDQSPVRFLDVAVPGSPVQDLLQQPFMRELIEKQPTFKQSLLAWLNRVTSRKASTAGLDNSPGKPSGDTVAE